MAASPTTKKRVKKIARQMAEVQVAEELFGHYLNYWTQKEVSTLVKNGVLVVLPLEHRQGYQVGKYHIWKHNDSWIVLNIGNDSSIRFRDRLAAVFYSVFESRKLFHRAQEIWQADQLVRRLDYDQSFYRHKYKKACELHNEFAQDLYQARLSDVVPQLDFAQEHLQKMIKSAKYIKIWDTQP